MPPQEYYTISLICTHITGYAAARLMLEEKHDLPKFISPGDDTYCTLGKIGQYNVVVALISNNDTPAIILQNFPNIKFRLLIGIGSGAPSERHDIRLGDVVIGASLQKQDGYCFEYDTSKDYKENSTLPIQSKPPDFLQPFIDELFVESKLEGWQLDNIVTECCRKFEGLDGYMRPYLASDRLHCSHYIHQDDHESCHAACIDASGLVGRSTRHHGEDNPAVHHGIIAITPIPIRDAQLRNSLSKERNIICIQTGKADWINKFPCLAICGVSDYADTHSNREWQNYAAMTAAAYAKKFLNLIHRYRGIPAPFNRPPEIHETSPYRDIRFNKIDIPHRFFRPGRVFAMIWREPRSKDEPKISSGKGTFRNCCFSKLRRFIVVHKSFRASLCVPLHTYCGQGIHKLHIKKTDHAKVYDVSNEIPPSDEGFKLRDPIGVHMEGQDAIHTIHPKCVANFGKIYTVEHDFEVVNIGYVPREHLPRLQIKLKRINHDEDTSKSSDSEDEEESHVWAKESAAPVAPLSREHKPVGGLKNKRERILSDDEYTTYRKRNQRRGHYDEAELDYGPP